MISSDSSALQFSLRRYLRETILPIKGYARLLLMLVLFKACSYWLISHWLHPDEPLSVLAMYRVGDIQYYPLFSALARLIFGEHSLFEHVGQGLLSLPFPLFFLHALGLRFLGSVGFIAVDILAAFSYYAILVMFLRVLNIPRKLAECTGILVISQAPEPLFALLRRLYRDYSMYRYPLLLCLGASLAVLGFVVLKGAEKGSLQMFPRMGRLAVLVLLLIPWMILGPNGMPVWWGWRIPRPFITGIISLGCLCLLVTLWLHHRKYLHSPKFAILWGGLGIGIAALVQSDIYSAESILILTAGMMGYLLFVHSQQERASYIKGFLIFGSVALVTTCPFFFQRAFEHPDVPLRLGLFPLKSFTVVFLPGWAPYFSLAALGICGGGLVCLIRQKYNTRESRGFEARIGILISFCMTSCLALPLLTGLFSKGIQLYHFLDRFRRMLSFTSLVFFLYSLRLLPLYFPQQLFRKPRLFQKYWKTSSVIMAVGVLSVLATLSHAYQLAQRETHMRTDFKEYATLIGYRNDFLEVVKVLLQCNPADTAVLGTLDHQLSSWWTGFKNGYSFFSDPCNSPLPDKDLELRLIAFAKLLNMNSRDFITFINREYVNYFGYGCFKYKVSPLYTFAPHSEYDADILQRKLSQIGILSGEVLLPISEQQRLLSLYERTTDSVQEFRLDLLVLTNDESLRSFVPPTETFELIFQNPSFRIWKKRTPELDGEHS